MVKKLWGSRFGKKMNPLVEDFTRSIQYDHKLARHDLAASLLHVRILRRAGYLNNAEAARLVGVLESILKSVEEGSFKADKSCEDIHTQIQNMVLKKASAVALKLHTARSRNEQVVLATKMYCKSELNKLQKLILSFEVAIGSLAMKNNNVIIPGFTHMQHAQPVYLKDHLSAYIEMLKRDHERIGHILKNIKLVMGAGALAGTPIDSKKYAIKGSVQPAVNSLDAVSDRDFVVEILSALAITGMHLSRLAEDLIMWSTAEFGFVEIDESFCSGSSLMPQKKNPDALELVRGYAGRLYGNLMSLLTVMKGLPLTYNRDMQLDKEGLFDSFQIVSSELEVLTGLIKTLKFNEEKIGGYLRDESLYATDLMYYLIDRGTPFKTAHTIVGRLIKYSIDNSVGINRMDEAELKKFSNSFVKKEIIKLFDPKTSVESKRSIRRRRGLREAYARI